MTIQLERSFSGAKFNNTSRNNWKPSFGVNYSKNSTMLDRACKEHVTLMQSKITKSDMDGTQEISRVSKTVSQISEVL